MIDPLITVALRSIFKIRDKWEYEITKVSKPYAGVVLFTVGPLDECYGVAENMETAVEYAEISLFESLKSEPEIFDSKWLLQFARVDLESVPSPKTESERVALIRQYGLDIEAAMVDYRRPFKTVEGWIESVIDAFSFSFKIREDCVYWQR